MSQLRLGHKMKWDVRGSLFCAVLFLLLLYCLSQRRPPVIPVTAITGLMDDSPSEIERAIPSVNTTESAEKGIQTLRIFGTHQLSKSIDNIFFIETSCASNKKQFDRRRPILKPRQACAIYSTAYHNPKRHVILIFTCPLLHNFYDESPPYVRAILDLPNFSMARVNLTEMYERSNLSVFPDGALHEAAYPVEHNADIIRILLVYVFGGTYMDLDFVSTRPLDDLGINYIGAEVDDAVATGAFNFEPKHPYLKEILGEMYQSYKPSEWNSIGPVLATSVLQKFCSLTLYDYTHLTIIGHISRCGITVHSDKVFYPIRHWDWNLYMDPTNMISSVIQHLKNTTYAFHVWNHKSANTQIQVGSQQPYGILADQNCAPVYRQCGQFF
uniref:Lactosylceramide 4-alpha-galactosyltransferase n=1 Tax=Lygus hesperus TaxID=30085 RepID=A0A0A9Y9Z2_LYGHE